MTQQTEIQGTVQRITFHSEATEYTVFRLLPDGQSNPIVCVASLPGIKEGGKVLLSGSWQLHAQYGRNFAVTAMELLLPANVAGMLSYLGSGMFKGIRRKRAASIVQKFGMESLQIIADTPERLSEIGIPATLAKQMQKTLLENRESERLTLYLQSHGLSTALSLRIYRHYKGRETSDLIALIEANPYRLAEEVFGIGFRTADRLALQLNIPVDSPLRLRVGLSYILSQATEDGHCYLPEEELILKAGKQLEVSTDNFAPLLEELLGRRELIAEGEPGQRRIYLPPFYHAEIGVAKHLAFMLQADNGNAQISLTVPQHADNRQEDQDDQNDQFAELEKALGLSLAEEQRQALRETLKHPMQIITGGPGTGKTTLLRALLLLFRGLNIRTLLAAPTGRAARRLSEVTGVTATTLHRLLEYAPSGAGMIFQRNEDNPLSADAVIIDEASMLDLLLFNNLLKALPPGCRLILVGDQDQLPSVGPGQVLRDLIACGYLPTVVLRIVFRQASQSQIIVNAHRINQGLVPRSGGKDSDFFFIEAANPLQVLEEIVDLCKRRLPGYAQVDPIEDIQVLCPMRRGVVGVESLNQRLQQALNPLQESSDEEETETEREIISLGDRFRLGDKVMQLKNNYDKGVFNGDIGKVCRIDAIGEELWVEFPDGQGILSVAYRQKDLDEITLAYAISVHKAQGSEYPVVVMPLLPEHNWLLQRNLLYTAVTRARKLLVLIGNRQLLQRTVERTNARERYTRLAERIISQREFE